METKDEIQVEKKPAVISKGSTKNLKSSWSIYLRLLKSSRPYFITLLLGLTGTLLSSGADSALSWAVKPLVDQGLVARNKIFLVWLPFIVVIAFVLRGGTLFLSNYCIMRVGRTVVMDFRQQIFNRLLRLPTSYYERETSGHLLSLIIYNTEQLAIATTNALLTLLQEGLLFVGLIVVMFIIDKRLTMLFIVSAPAITWIIRYTTKRLRMLSSRVQKSVGDVTHIAEEVIEGYKVIRVFGGENYEKQKFMDATTKNRHQEMKVVMTDSLGTSLVQIIASLPIALVVYVAILFHTTIGTFSAMIVAIIRLMTPIRRLTKINTDIQRGVAAAQSIFSLLEEAEEKDCGTKTLHRVQGNIEYSDVYFKYPSLDRAILNHVSLKIEPGQTVALVGRSGSGKSTLVSLLPRFYDVLSGAILLDDLSSMQEAFSNFSDLIQLYPESKYVKDSRQRMFYIRNVMAAHEVGVAKFYLERKAYVAAANRADYVVRHFQGAPQTEEALRIMIKSYQELGATEQLKKTIQVFKINYPKSKI